jgi:recombination protein RecT
MSTQTVTGAVAVRQKQDQIIDWIRGQQDEIAMVAATHVKPSAIVRVAHGALRRNPKLMTAAIANPQSLLYALLDAARLGHEPDTDDYYLVPFGLEVTGIEGYKGIIERMYRAGGVSSVVAEVVHQKDVYRRTGATTPPVHEYDEFADPEERGPLRGAYAYAVMLDGRFSKVIPMGRAEIMRHKAKSKGSDKDDSPWQQWPEAMWKKCPLRGLEPYVPTSTEYRNGAGPDPHPAHAAGALPAGTAIADTQVYDAEIVPDEPQNGNGHAPRPAPPAEVPGQQEPAPPGPDAPGLSDRPGTITSDQRKALVTALRQHGYTSSDPAAKREVCEKLAGRKFARSTTDDMSEAEAERVTAELESHGDREALDRRIAEIDGAAS